MKNRISNAFTLMELMIVIIILGILAGFALPNYSASILKARERDAYIQLTAIHAANLVYRAQQGEYLNGNGGVAYINSNLGLNVIQNGITYNYNGGVNSFTATATESGGGFTVTVDENPIDPGTNPSCAGTCKLYP